MSFGVTVQACSLAVFAALMATVLACVFWDRKKNRAKPGFTPISIVVPCFNDGPTVADTVRSVFAAWPAAALDVIVINDASTDDSLDRIRALQCEYPVRLINHPHNRGKVAVLNGAIPEARHELVLCLDADTAVTREALEDMLARLGHDARIGAVSCPYAPSNRGFLPAMQAIEYSMMRLGQGAGNVTSALALWGGCLMVRKAALHAVGGFSANAITEDVDLAFRLNRAGWRVEQSFVFVRSLVPDQWRVWFRQKRRWTAGGFQCVFRYPFVWMTNPLQLLFVASYTALTVSWLCGFLGDSSLLGMGRHVFSLWAEGIPASDVLLLADALYRPSLAAKLVGGLVFSSVSMIYVLPRINRIGDWMRIGLVIPFSMGYFPLYVVVSLFGLVFWFFGLRKLPAWRRAW